MLTPEEKSLSKKYKGLILLKNYITNSNIEIGDYTYYDNRDKPEATFEKENVIFALTAKLKMGNFVKLPMEQSSCLKMPTIK